MKLINLNVEHDKHFDRVVSFVDRENPDVLCLQEATPLVKGALEERGYTTAFLPIILATYKDELVSGGMLIASKLPFTAKEHYYYQPNAEIVEEIPLDKINTVWLGYIVADIEFGGATYTIVTSHGAWTQHGNQPCEHQQAMMKLLIESLQKEKPHVLCGDMNVPRHHSFLYENFLEQYTDSVPEEYASSLDKSIHYLGSNPEKQNLFTDFMVDYIFTQPPYKAEGVRLEFGISDHAAVVATISK